jgi:hypothetical protein
MADKINLEMELAMSSENKEDCTRNQASPVSLRGRLASNGMSRLNHAGLLQFLSGQELAPLGEYISQDRSFTGATFMLKFFQLFKQFSKEFQYLQERELALLPSSPANTEIPKKKRTFSTNTAIDRDSGHYYVDRSFAVELSEKIQADPGIFLVHGPRSSGKSTMLDQMINYLLSENSNYVYASIDVLGLSISNAPHVDNFVLKLMKELSDDTSSASREVRVAAAAFIKDHEMTANGIQFLFKQDYQGRKLILFVDEFDAAYDKPFSDGFAGYLRDVKNHRKTLPSFQAIVCMGAYNASRLTGGFNSPFVEDKVFTHEQLDFSLDEVRSLFVQYMDDHKVKVDDEVIESIFLLTGGHTGLVNACGYEIQRQRDSHVSLAIWDLLQGVVVNEFASRKVFAAITEAFKSHPHPHEIAALLRKLCYGDGVYCPCQDACSQCLLQLGLASIRRRDQDQGLSSSSNFRSASSSVFNMSGLQDSLTSASGTSGSGPEWLVVKSELMRRCSLLYLFGDCDIFPTSLPMLDGKLDIQKFLTTVFQCLDPSVIRSAFQYSHKKHVVAKAEYVPSEVVYQHQLSAIIIRAFRHQSLWRCVYESNSQLKKLDLLLLGPSDLKVGIELTASVDVDGLQEHAARSYSPTLKLDQYVVVNITSIYTEKVFETFTAVGVDKNNNHCVVPVYHVLHNREYTEVQLHTGPGAVITVI